MELRELPSVDRLLRHPALSALPRELALDAAREVLDEARAATRNGGWPHSLEDLPGLVEDRVQQVTRPRLRPVINASGVIIHTNLGRAPLSSDALRAANAAGRGYSNLEYDLAAGERGSRHNLVTDLLRRLTGAEDALVTNNDAATTPQTAVLLRVHASNFLQVGFVHQPTLEELVEVGTRHTVPVVDDLGSGSLLDTARFGLAREPMVQASVAAGVALVAFSGDKLLGGPQAGIVVGRSAEIGRLRHHPLMRAIRPDKLTLAALGATLVHYVRGEAEREVPVWRMISAPAEALRGRAERLASALGGCAIETRSAIGGGSLPGQTQPSWAVGLAAESVDGLAARLRRADPPVIARIESDQVLLDLRSVLPEQDTELERSVAHA